MVLGRLTRLQSDWHFRVDAGDDLGYFSSDGSEKSNLGVRSATREKFLRGDVEMLPAGPLS